MNPRPQAMSQWQRGLCLLLAIGLSSLAYAQEQADDTSVQPRPAEPAARATHAALLDVAHAEQTWIAVGTHGVILRSADAVHWTQIPSPVDIPLTRVRFTDADHVWVIGYDGVILTSNNGGQHWKIQSYDAQWGRPWFDVRTLDAQHALLAGANGALKRSVDGGQHWQTIDDPAFADQPNLYSICPLADGQVAVVGERGFLARSNDQGAHWQRLRSPYSGSLFGALPVGAHGLLAFGLRGNVFFNDNLAAATVLSPAEAEALRNAGSDPQSAAQASAPISAVPGWRALHNPDEESLYTGIVRPDRTIDLLGGNGHIVHVDLHDSSLSLISPVQAAPAVHIHLTEDGHYPPESSIPTAGAASPLAMAINGIAGDSEAWVVVGTAGVKFLPAPPHRLTAPPPTSLAASIRTAPDH